MGKMRAPDARGDKDIRAYLIVHGSPFTVHRKNIFFT